MMLVGDEIGLKFSAGVKNMAGFSGFGVVVLRKFHTMFWCPILDLPSVSAPVTEKSFHGTLGQMRCWLNWQKNW
jgi:hypothetical protein